MTEVWDLVPKLTTTEAVCLLALARCEDVHDDLSEMKGYVAVDEVAATAGLSIGTAGDALRKLAAHGHLDKVPYLSETSAGRPCARVGYRIPEGQR